MFLLHPAEISHQFTTKKQTKVLLVKKEGGHYIVKLAANPLDEEARALIARESLMLDCLAHTGIVRKYGDMRCEEEEGAIFLEYISGQSAQELIGSGEMFHAPVRQRMRLLQSAAEVIAYIHQQGIVQRDIKPANLVVSKSYQSLTMIDFEMSYKITEPMPGTNDGRAFGSIPYFPKKDGRVTCPSEEVFEPALGQQTDIYALGTTMLEFFLPTEGVWDDVFRKPQRAINRMKDKHQKLSEIISNCVDLDHQKRPTAQMVYDGLSILCQEYE